MHNNYKQQQFLLFFYQIFCIKLNKQLKAFVLRNVSTCTVQYLVSTHQFCPNVRDGLSLGTIYPVKEH